LLRPTRVATGAPHAVPQLPKRPPRRALAGCLMPFNVPYQEAFFSGTFNFACTLRHRIMQDAEPPSFQMFACSELVSYPIHACHNRIDIYTFDHSYLHWTHARRCERRSKPDISSTTPYEHSGDQFCLDRERYMITEGQQTRGTETQHQTLLTKRRSQV
jgi:hypothetical protein